jgi:hypothetical protein
MAKVLLDAPSTTDVMTPCGVTILGVGGAAKASAAAPAGGTTNALATIVVLAYYALL